MSALDGAATPQGSEAFPDCRLHPLKGDLKGFWSVTVERTGASFEGTDALDGVSRPSRLQASTASLDALYPGHPVTEEGKRVSASVGLQVLQPGIKYFFDAVEFGAPQVAHVVETLVHRVKPLVDRRESLIHYLELSVDISDEQPYQDCVEKHRHADDEIKLFVGHFLFVSLLMLL